MNSPESLTQRFPYPNTPQLQAAYHHLYLAANGTDEERRKLGNPAHLPRPWDPPTCTNPDLRAELWAWLEDVVTWLNHDYVWDHTAGLIPPCWPLHPHLVHEIAVLADQRRRASLDLTSSALEEWHRYGLPTFLDRLKGRARNLCDDRHSPWPAKGRHDRHVSQAAVTTRQTAYQRDIDTTTQATVAPTPQETRQGLRLITEDGERVDPATGEVL